jgi:hypothetical protein
MSARQCALSVHQFHRRAARSPKRRLGATERRGRVPQQNRKRRTYETSSCDCHSGGIHWHGDGNTAAGELLSGQRKMLQHQML